mmetsp:Transcript_8609/g.14550  ORF Transcript_8609/g.14550 Transcript_8609/m.14550 type:complete len:236 (-) Transcript_8609:1827-2534(-)
MALIYYIIFCWAWQSGVSSRHSGRCRWGRRRRCTSATAGSAGRLGSEMHSPHTSGSPASCPGTSPPPSASFCSGAYRSGSPPAARPRSRSTPRSCRPTANSDRQPPPLHILRPPSPACESTGALALGGSGAQCLLLTPGHRSSWIAGSRCSARSGSAPLSMGRSQSGKTALAGRAAPSTRRSSCSEAGAGAWPHSPETFCAGTNQVSGRPRSSISCRSAPGRRGCRGRPKRPQGT